MTAGEMMQPWAFEVVRLETQRRNVQTWHCLTGRVSEIDISHEDHPPLELQALNRRRSSPASHFLRHSGLASRSQESSACGQWCFAATLGNYSRDAYGREPPRARTVGAMFRTRTPKRSLAPTASFLATSGDESICPVPWTRRTWRRRLACETRLSDVRRGFPRDVYQLRRFRNFRRSTGRACGSRARTPVWRLLV